MVLCYVITIRSSVKNFEIPSLCGLHKEEFGIIFCIYNYTPANFVCGGVYCFHVVRPCVRVSVRDTLVFS